MNLSEWASRVGVSECSACWWHHARTLQVRALRAGRLVLVEPVAISGPGRTVSCAQVWSACQCSGLGRPVARLAGWVTASSQILDTGEAEDDLIKDMTEVVISFCVRLYGHLGVRSRVLRAVDCAQAV